MITGREFAECALLPKWEKYSYNQMDCQAFVENVLKDVGIRKPDGTVYNWRGSNSMFRNYYTWRGTKAEAIKKYGDVPIGAFVYVWQETGEEQQGYKDGRGNAKHVGIYCGNNVVRDSTRYKDSTGNYVRDGVGTTTLKNFSRVTLFIGIDYKQTNSYTASVEDCMLVMDKIRNKIADVKDLLTELEGKIYDIK
ncbi:MAG: hypothetical protein J6S67_00835 [Methanobrevibacter sp.]|nr:hypothetical protein [Methanobrevibacter sp.]